MKRKKKENDLSSTIKGENFERKIESLFKLMGYNTKRNIMIGNYETDIYCEMNVGGTIYRCMVECKDYKKDNKVGIKDVGKFVGNFLSAKNKNQIDKGIIVTNSSFTIDGFEAAKDGGIDAFTFKDLMNYLINIDKFLESIIKDYECSDIFELYIDLYCKNNENIVLSLSTFIDKWIISPERNYLSILADYGTGKTSFCNRFAYECALKYLNNPIENRIPILIPLREYSRFSNIEYLIIDVFKKYQIKINDYNIFKKMNEEGKFVLIFDGFDEMSTHIDEHAIVENLKEILKITEKKSKVILTCRTHFFKSRHHEEIHLRRAADNELLRLISNRPNFEIIYLCEFEEHQIIKYLKLYFKDKWKHFFERINQTYNLGDLVKRAILLDVIVKTLPKLSKEIQVINVALLYKTYTDFWLDREDWRFNLNYDDRIFFVEELAYNMSLKNDLLIHYTTLPIKIKKYFRNKLSDKSLLENIDGDIRTCSFLRRREDGYYYFMHKSFVEYFAARKICKEINEGNFQYFSKKEIEPEIYFFLMHLIEKTELPEIYTGIWDKKLGKTIRANLIRLLGYLANEVKKIEKINLKNLNLSGANLKDVNLSYADMSGAILTWTRLENAKLDEINLENCNLSNSIMEGVSLINANLNNASLKGCNLAESDLYNSNLSEVNLNNSNLAGANLSKCNLERADLNNSNLNGVDFRDAHIFKANLSKCICKNTKFCNANLTESKLKNIIFEEADLRNTILNKVVLIGSNKIGPSIKRTNFFGADFSGSNFYDSDFHNLEFVCVNFSNCDFTNCDLNGANLMGCNFENTKFRFVNAKKADFQHANLTNADFFQANLSEAFLHNSKICNTNFEKANLSKTNFVIYKK